LLASWSGFKLPLTKSIGLLLPIKPPGTLFKTPAAVVSKSLTKSPPNLVVPLTNASLRSVLA